MELTSCYHHPPALTAAKVNSHQTTWANLGDLESATVASPTADIPGHQEVNRFDGPAPICSLNGRPRVAQYAGSGTTCADPRGIQIGRAEDTIPRLMWAMRLLREAVWGAADRITALSTGRMLVRNATEEDVDRHSHGRLGDRVRDLNSSRIHRFLENQTLSIKTRKDTRRPAAPPTVTEIRLSARDLVLW